MLTWRKRRVPFKPQHADSDCGAACLAMILEYFGQRTSIYSVRRACEGFGPPESTRAIIAAARMYGLESNLLASDVEALGAVQLPCIIYWRFSHFVVLTAITKKGFKIVDPAQGHRMVSVAEFDRNYTGIAVSLSAGNNFKAGTREINFRFRAFVKVAFRSVGGWKLLGWIIASSIALQALSLLLPLATVYMVDTLIPASLSEAMLPLLGVIILLGLNAAALSHARSRLILALQTSVDSSLLRGYLTHLLSLPLRFFSDRATPEIQGRMNSNAVIRDVLSSYTVTGVIDIVMASSYLIILMLASPLFAGLTLLLASAQLLVHVMWLREMGDRISAELRTQTNYQNFVAETITGIATVKGAGAEPEVERVWRRKLNNYLTAARNRGLLDAYNTSLGGTVRLLSPIILLWFGCKLYFDGALTIGEVLAVNSIAAMALVPLASLIMSVRQIQLLQTHSDRMGDTWMHEPEKTGSLPCPPVVGSGTLRLENVSFRYKSAKESSLVDVSLDIPFGKKIGIVGPSGSGKSTLLSVLMGLFQPDAGRVSIDGVPLNDVDIRTYRRKVAYVAQDTFLFSGSIRSNVSLGNPSLSVGEVDAALNGAGMSETVAAMPMGIETRVGELGNRLSGGQRQRIAIARAIARRPDILILDEATSNLDGVTEEWVTQSVGRMEITRVVVSHRISTVSDCDIIYVLDKGRIVSSGTSEEVAASNAFYRMCLESQGLAMTTNIDASGVAV